MNWLDDFCKLNSNREGTIVELLNREDISYTIIELNDARHVVLFPKNLISRKETTILLAHYDRVKNTPGANDNSASVYFLLKHSIRLKELDHSTVIIFTDKEEITGTESVTSQGAYSLGNYFRSKKMHNLRFYVFDMCGIGSTLLLGTAGESLIKDHYGNRYIKSEIKKKIDNVKDEAEEHLLSVNGGEFFYSTPLFSDDLGLILNEYPAILISLLPYREAIEYSRDSSQLPKSWQCNHTMDDSVNTLDEKSWGVLSKLLLKLSEISDKYEVTNYKELSFNCYLQDFRVKTTTKRLLDCSTYIKKPLFDISTIKTSNRERLLEFLLFMSQVNENVMDYYINRVEPKTVDLSLNIYNYIKEVVKNNFRLLPIVIKDKINREIKNDETEVYNSLYNTVIGNLEEYLYDDVTPLKMKNKVSMDISGNEFDKELIIVNKSKEIGRIKLQQDNRGYILDSGYFNPEQFTLFDTLNLLKGIRLGLIKWSELNNNNSLRFNLIRSNWLGCNQLYKLLKIELEGKRAYPKDSSKIYMWKRSNG